MKNTYVSRLGAFALAVCILGIAQQTMALSEYDPGEPFPQPYILWIGLGMVALWLVAKGLTEDARPSRSATPREPDAPPPPTGRRAAHRSGGSE